MVAVGIDVGTTNVGLIALDLVEGRVVDRASVPNLRVPSADYSYNQDPAAIAASVRTLLSRLPMKISCIGVTGQVHGILYTDGRGNPLSPLYTWLDRSGVEPVNGETPANRLLARTGKTLPAGYGLLTHYAHTLRGTVPEGAAHILGICEYVTGSLTGKIPQKTDPSCLAPFGVWDPVTGHHDPDVLREVLPPGSPGFLTASMPFESAGRTSGGVPVCYPVGDNQAGFFSLVPDVHASCLVSLGTSGQITVYTPTPGTVPGMELRPFLGLGYLQVGATLCAGKAYEVLERFFRSVLERSGVPVPDDAAVYAMMEKAAREAPGGLTVTTSLNGTRADSSLRGSIAGIGLDNFSVGNLVLGTVDGIVRELHDFTRNLDEEFRSIRRVVAAGNAARKNPLFARSLKKQFGLEIEVPEFDDAAAIGIALIAAVSAGIIAPDDRQSFMERLSGAKDS